MRLFALVGWLLLAALPARAQYILEDAFPNLSFDDPVGLFAPPDGTNRLFLLERDGRVQVVENLASTTTKTLALDIVFDILAGGELGLLGLAFHPDFATNQELFLNYTTDKDGPLRTVVARYTMSAGNPDVIDASSREVLLEFDQPRPNHNGGSLAFGPDGHLYISVGDGGGDNAAAAQDRTNLYGSILRIDVDGTDPGLAYRIPPDNPWADNTQGFREEIFAFGFRNPWKISFDHRGWLWTGDVGEFTWEEIDVVVAGQNYGWNIMEGAHCFEPSSGCNTGGLVYPLFEYEHGNFSLCVLGGFVYEGWRLPELTDRYIYSDHGSGNLWALDYSQGAPVSTFLVSGDRYVFTSLGVDASGEIYVLSLLDKVYRLSRTDATPAPTRPARTIHLDLPRPNPFNPSTQLRYELFAPGEAQLTIYDVAGRRVRGLADGFHDVGEHSATWNGRNDDGVVVASGVYLVELRSGPHTARTRVVLGK